MTESPDAMRQVIREIVREVIREVVVEEMALGTPVERTPATSARRTEPRPVSPSSESLHVASGALTERHLRALGDAHVIRIGRRVVITPLARDWARSRGIDIIRIDG